MTRIDRHFREAERVAERVAYRWRLGAVITRGGKLLSRGGVKFRHHPRIDKVNSTQHAEATAIKECKLPTLRFGSLCCSTG